MSKTATRIIIAVVIAIVLFFVVKSIMGNDPKSDPVAQAEAFSNAVEVGVSTVENRTATDKDIDRATSIALLEIDNAADFDAVRNAVRNGVCEREAHHYDPAC